MTIHEAEEIIASLTGGRDSWDSEALREVAEAAIAGRPPQGSWSPDDIDGLLAAFTLINS